MTEQTLPEKYSDPERYKLLDSGAIYDLQAGRIVANIGGKYTITPEMAKSIAQRKKEIGIIAQMRGLALANGNELPEDADIETIVRAAGSAIEALTAHMGKTFLQSKNVRGLGEAYKPLVAGFIE